VVQEEFDRSKFPNHLILSDKVYKLSIIKKDSHRAFDRFLTDYFVEGVNLLSNSDKWKTLLGASHEVYEDYPSFKQIVPFEWVLIRFLYHHVRTNSVHILSGPGGEVLATTNFKDYLGRRITDAEVEEVLRIILRSWVCVFPEENIALGDIYVSTDIPIDTLKRGINSLKFQHHIEEIDQNIYRVNPSIFNNLSSSKNMISLDRKSNRYYQEIQIEAVEPFCFVLMPLKEEEFPQRIYTETIKPLIENGFKISCYRVDEDHLPDRIDNKIYTYLLRSAFVIAEITSSNPNVFYELGLAHMLEKDCIILTKKSTSELPFDINKLRAEQYTENDQLIEILKESISALAFKIK